MKNSMIKHNELVLEIWTEMEKKKNPKHLNNS